MNTKREYDKKKLIILRAVLIVIGGAVGATAVWQYFVYFPDVMRSEFKAVFTVVSGVVLAAILGLSAKPFYRLGSDIAESVGGVAARLGGTGVAAVVLGLVAAVVAVLLVDAVMATYGKIWAVRILADMLVYIIFAALCCHAFTRWLSAPDDTEEGDELKRGYLLAAECLSDERVLSAAEVLVNVKVGECAYKALCLAGDADGVRRLDRLVALGAAEQVRCKKQFSTKEECVEWEKATAAKKHLKYVTPADIADGDVTLALFASPTDDIRAKYAADAPNTDENV